MRIDIALKEQFNISRQKAKELIENGKVTLNGKTVLKSSREVSDCDVLKIKDFDILKYVSRGGLKLEKALDSFKINVDGLTCLDIGASTGGFTDCLLQKGARRVFALDVGTSQLAESLRNDERVISMENTDIRNADIERVDFICMDVSFISVTKVLYKAEDLLKDKGKAVILIKPQFEAGREYLNKKGIVKDTKIHKRVINAVVTCAKEVNLTPLGIDISPIKGGDGNTEYLLYLEKNSDTTAVLDFNTVISKGALNK